MVLKDIVDKLTWTHFGKKRRSHEEEEKVIWSRGNPESYGIPKIGYFGHIDSITNKKEESWSRT